jgi:UDP:flavonoid glycosyltransferase YjiC (YdhE family)
VIVAAPMYFRREPFYRGLVIVRADQCPYTVANVKEIARVARNDFPIPPKIVELKSAMGSQHSISATRFRNIMSKLV